MQEVESSFSRSVSFGQRLMALMRRERITRFAGGQISSLWAYLTPVFWIAFVAGFFSLVGRVVPILTEPALFVATGILPYAIMRQAITSMTRSNPAHRLLLQLPSVSLFEVLLATACLELFTNMLTGIFIFGMITLLYDISLPDNLSLVTVSLMLAWLLGVSLGNLFAAIGRVSDTFARAVPLFLRPLFWISGIFYIAAEMPAGVLYYLSYNPLLHVIEALREGYFFGYHSLVSSLIYPVYFAVTCLFFSFVINSWVTRHKLSRHRV